MWKEGETKIGKENRCTESGGDKKVRKTDVAMQDMFCQRVIVYHRNVGVNLTVMKCFHSHKQRC